MDELPEDTQREIEKIQWDEQQKLNGKLRCFTTLSLALPAVPMMDH